MDRRKHYTQMTQAEADAVLKAVRNIKTVTTTPYFKGRMDERRITNLDIAITLTKGFAVEVHNNKADEVRVVMKAEVRGRWCHVVISLTTGTLITCYWNALNDFHATLDKSQYKWTANLCTII